MSTIPIPAAPTPKRRKQAERRAETHQRLIDATVECLYRLGYGATTISLVAKEAKVARSLIAYHFASKAELMVAVRDAVWHEERKALDRFDGIDPRSIMLNIYQAVFAGMRKKPAIAVNEIMLAARGDPELRFALKQTEGEIENRVLVQQAAFFERNGLSMSAHAATLNRLTVATIRGLAIAELVQGEEAETDACLKLLAELVQARFGPLGEP